MAKVAGRVTERRGAVKERTSFSKLDRSGKILDTKVSASSGFKGLKEMNRKALLSLKH
jgi:hypothetical protein